LNPNSNGTVKILNTTSFSNPNVGYRINNGNLIIQSAFQTVPLQTFIEAKGNANVSVEGSFLRNGMSLFHGTALSDSVDFNILGTYSQNDYRISSTVKVFGSTPLKVNKIDVLSPSEPTNLQATPTSSNQIDLSWNSSSDNHGVAGYNIFRDGVKIATTSTTNYIDAGLNAETFYDYFVTAFDAANNNSNPSDTVFASTFAVGIWDLNNVDKELIVYPNPANGKVFILLPGTIEPKITFKLYSVTGQLFFNKSIPVPTTKNEIQLDISNLSDGLYFYNLFDSQKSYTGKLYIVK
ncbi:MAG: T9SS type A sorting domain-containing protein, partial [Draconibacterium sp.]|nr:T9SS type A sorting domain-containing protein [Draconibacterium sp.]